MSRKVLPDAIEHFMSAIAGVDRADADRATRRALDRSLALSVVGLSEGERFAGAAGIRTLMESSPVFGAHTSWSIVYAMDSEFVLQSESGDEVQLLLDCGRIALIRITARVDESDRQSIDEAVLAA